MPCIVRLNLPQGVPFWTYQAPKLASDDILQAMKVRKVAVVIFYDKNLNLVVQKRSGNSSKVGEYFGLWGGEIKSKESPKEALARELDEELGYKPKKLEFWEVFKYSVKEKGAWHGHHILQYVFLSSTTPELLNSKVLEGDGFIIISLEKAIKGEGFPKDSMKFLKGFKARLQK